MHCTGLQALTQGAVLSPFTRTRAPARGHRARSREADRADRRRSARGDAGFVADKLVEAKESLGSYPKIRGSDELRKAIAAWIGRRYGLAGDRLRRARCSPSTARAKACSSRRCRPSAARASTAGPSCCSPNPFYQAYLGGAYATGCEPVYLNATAETGHLPDLDALEREPDILRRTAGSLPLLARQPAGRRRRADYIARRWRWRAEYDFMLFIDECYSEIYTGAEAPTGGLQVAAATPERFKNLVVFNSLSKRSNLPGLRSGFVAGDGDFLETLAEIRNLTARRRCRASSSTPPPRCGRTSSTSRVIRQAYRAKFDVCDELLTGRFGYRRPGGGFFLWLDMSHLGGGEQAALTIWKRCGVKVIPGVYLAQRIGTASIRAESYVRVALVHDAATVREALERIVELSA